MLLGGGGVLSLRFVERVVAQGELIGRTIQRMAAQIAESFAEGSWVLVSI